LNSKFSEASTLLSTGSSRQQQNGDNTVRINRKANEFVDVPAQELSRIQKLLKEVASDTSTILTLRKEYDERQKMIDSKIEELTLSSQHSLLSEYTVPFQQPVSSECIQSNKSIPPLADENYFPASNYKLKVMVLILFKY